MLVPGIEFGLLQFFLFPTHDWLIAKYFFKPFQSERKSVRVSYMMRLLWLRELMRDFIRSQNQEVGILMLLQICLCLCLCRHLLLIMRNHSYTNNKLFGEWPTRYNEVNLNLFLNWKILELMLNYLWQEQHPRWTQLGNELILGFNYSIHSVQDWKR